ncbi:hypothetical protein J437_LFUL018731 [Ladona fulva]|uniref:Uncharacterized protein n=1 Tax=Ladona fulva TaxID=123851 RepID=A0A8K0P7M8_LADFU|nr:hypothetical protein J437_LFUL018731 [Ladona fulva]
MGKPAAPVNAKAGDKGKPSEQSREVKDRHIAFLKLKDGMKVTKDQLTQKLTEALDPRKDKVRIKLTRPTKDGAIMIEAATPSDLTKLISHGKLKQNNCCELVLQNKRRSGRDYPGSPKGPPAAGEVLLRIHEQSHQRLLGSHPLCIVHPATKRSTEQGSHGRTLNIRRQTSRRHNMYFLVGNSAIAITIVCTQYMQAIWLSQAMTNHLVTVEIEYLGQSVTVVNQYRQYADRIRLHMA